MEEAGDDGAKGGGSGDEPTAAELQAKLTDLQSQFEKVNAKKDELLTETKQAKEARRLAEEQAEQKALEAAKKAGDHESLYKSAMEKLTAEQEAHKTLLGQISSEKLSNSAMKIAVDLADGANAELLSAFIGQRLKYDDGEVKVTDDKGSLTISSFDDLKKEFANDPRYAALLKGNQSSGGGATGGKNSGGAAKTLTRAEFDALPQNKRQPFFKDGGTITD